MEERGTEQSKHAPPKFVLGLVVLAATSMAGAQSYPEGMMCYWKLDEGIDSTAHDAVNDYDVTIHGATWIDGVSGKALRFDGVTDYAKGTHPSLQVVSVEAWVKLASYPRTYRYGMVAGSTGPGGCTFSEILEVDPYRRASFYHWDGSGVRRPVGTTSLNLDEWYHLVGVVDGELVRLYLNGELEGTAPTGPGYQQNPEVVFSYTNNCWGYNFSHEDYDGAVDEVALYDSVLTPEEIVRHYQNGLLGLGYELPCTDPDPASQGYWHRQCLGLPATDPDCPGIDPGRSGRGPEEPTEPTFCPDLMACADQTLEALGFYGLQTCQGMDADTPSDPCQRAEKQLTALILNVCAERLGESCEVDVSAEGCSSTNVGDLIDEVSALIQIADCSTASDCAGAVNDGDALVSGIGAGASNGPDGIQPELEPRDLEATDDLTDRRKRTGRRADRAKR